MWYYRAMERFSSGTVKTTYQNAIEAEIKRRKESGGVAKMLYALTGFVFICSAVIPGIAIGVEMATNHLKFDAAVAAVLDRAQQAREGGDGCNVIGEIISLGDGSCGPRKGVIEHANGNLLNIRIEPNLQPTHVFEPAEKVATKAPAKPTATVRPVAPTPKPKR